MSAVIETDGGISTKPIETEGSERKFAISSQLNALSLQLEERREERRDKKKKEKALQKKIIEEAQDFLVQGETFLKYGARGKPHT